MVELIKKSKKDVKRLYIFKEIKNKQGEIQQTYLFYKSLV